MSNRNPNRFGGPGGPQPKRNPHHNVMKEPCPVCKKRVKSLGLKQHMHDAHKHIVPREALDSATQDCKALLNAIEGARTGDFNGLNNLYAMARSIRSRINQTKGFTS